MAEQLPSGRWKAVRVTTAGEQIKIVDTPEEAKEWEGE
jgi:hypothetical protein